MHKWEDVKGAEKAMCMMPQKNECAFQRHDHRRVVRENQDAFTMQNKMV